MKICYIYFSMFLSLSVMIFFMGLVFLIYDYIYIIEMELFQLNSSKILMVMLFDWMSLLFVSFVMYISSMVIYYSKEYMSLDLNINRFILLVVMFVLSMILMIISPNLISILLGWDGLGLISYCLVIYYQNFKSYVAGMLTVLMNRIGDVALLMSISWMVNYGSWNYLFYVDVMNKNFSMQIISFLVILAGLTKSAQIPFSSWLPAAMAAPTPVSSLVHSSTLVTAGVYLLIRFNYAFSDQMKSLLLFISMMTMFMSGLGANYENDLKKIIALSTLSQLGFMMSILFMGDVKLSFFHLLNHALFKAMLFMCSGCIIHSMYNNQDIRNMGGLVNFMPLTFSIFLISTMSLCGFPFLVGFYSKDLLLEVMSMNHMSMFMYFMYYFSAGLTVSYSMRLLYYLVIKNYSFYSLISLNDNMSMLKSMMGLLGWVVIMGSLMNWIMFFTPYFICLPNIMKMMTLIFIISGGLTGVEVSKFNLMNRMNFRGFLNFSLFFSSMWNLNIVMIKTNGFIMDLSKFMYLKIDLGWSEYLGSQNIYMNLKNNSKLIQYFLYNNFKIILLLLLVHLFIMFIIF